MTMDEETAGIRAYQAIKARLTGGAFRPGERLDPARLAADIHVSPTTVYNVLRRLAVEHLVESSPHEGFHVLGVTEAQLRGTYRWHCVVATGAALNAAPQIGPAPASIEDGQGREDLAERAEALFTALAALTEIDEFRTGMAQVNDRLRAIRQLEPLVLPDLDDELAGLAAAQGEPQAMVRRLEAYRDRRLAAAPDLVRLRLRGAPGAMTAA